MSWLSLRLFRKMLIIANSLIDRIFIPAELKVRDYGAYGFGMLPVYAYWRPTEEVTKPVNNITYNDIFVRTARWLSNESMDKKVGSDVDSVTWSFNLRRPQSVHWVDISSKESDLYTHPEDSIG